MRFGVGARVWLTELMERDGVDAASALFSESTGRVIVTVPREDDVKFRGLCEGRGYPVLRIGVTDSRGRRRRAGARGAGTVHGAARRAARPVARRRCPPRSARPSPSPPPDVRPPRSDRRRSSERDARRYAADPRIGRMARTTTSTAATTTPGRSASRSSRGWSSSRSSSSAAARRCSPSSSADSPRSEPVLRPTSARGYHGRVEPVLLFVESWWWIAPVAAGAGAAGYAGLTTNRRRARRLELDAARHEERRAYRELVAAQGAGARRQGRRARGEGRAWRAAVRCSATRGASCWPRKQAREVRVPRSCARAATG